MWALWLNISRFSLVYILLELFIYLMIGKYYIPFGYIMFLCVSFVAIVGIEAGFFFYFYLKVKKMESIWDRSEIHKIKKSTGTWSRVQFRNLNVGDLIMLKSGTVAPADILIIDTSENHFSELILNANERRVTGCNRMTIKRAVKNMRGKIVVRHPYEAIKTILPSLEGQLEYEPPSERVAQFGGTFKLNNDPQVSRINHKNVLFCGTQLHTTWMMGIVLFTGQETKIVQMNLLQWSRFERLRKETKVSGVSLLMNWIILLYMGTGLLISLFLIVHMQFKDEQLAFMRLVEEFYVGGPYHKAAKVLLIWHGPLMFVPHLIVLVYEITCFVYGIKIQQGRDKMDLAKINAASSAIQQASEFQGRRNYKKRSTRNPKDSDATESKKSEPSLINEQNSPEFSLVKKKLRGSSRDPNSAESKEKKQPQGFPGSVRPAFGTSHPMSSKSTLKNSKAGEKSEEQREEVRVINYETLPDLGSISHVVFDKTDTLTMSNMHVCQLATREKIYRVEGEARIRDLMSLFDRNPQEFEFEEDEEEKKAKENTVYSEKSQEYHNEINGEFQKEVQGELSDDSIGSILAPSYNLGAKRHSVGALSDDGSGNYSSNSGTHKLKSMKSALHNVVGTTSLRRTDSLDVNLDDSFYQLNLLEKQFKKKTGKADGTEDDQDSEDVLISFRNGPNIKLNNEKQLSDKHLVADIRKRNESLEELLSYLFIMHMIEYGPQNLEEHYVRPEDEAIHDVLVSLGFAHKKILKAKDKEKAPAGEAKEIFAFDFDTSGGLKSTNKVFAKNIFSQKRGRKSMIIETPSENEPYLLIVFGSEKSMKNVLRASRNKKEDNLLRILVAKQKQKGLKVMVVAKKPLTADEVTDYTKEYGKISNSARDQIEDLEKLAIQMENDLQFVGCVGLRDSIRSEAIALTAELNKTNLKMSVMSGDEIENCLTVVQKLRICSIDIQNSSSFYWVRLAHERGILQEMRRIFDQVHDSLQNESYLTIERIVKVGKEKEELHKGLAQPLSAAPAKKTRPREDPADKRDPRDQPDEPTVREHINQLRKPLLLSGDSVDIIMNSPSLACHLRSILAASGSIVAYDMRPKHKAFVIDLMRKNKEIVMAVGDGFNDIGMLARANIGIQIYNPNVPLIFGDIVVTKLSDISPLMFVYGFRIKKNILIAFCVLVSVYTYAMSYLCFAAYFSLFTPMYSSLVSLAQAVNYLALLGCFLALFNLPGNHDLLGKLPAIYQENSFLMARLPQVFFNLALHSLFEASCLMLVSIRFVAQDLDEAGRPAGLNTQYSFFAWSFLISTLSKFLFGFSLKKPLRTAAAVLFFLGVYGVVLGVSASTASLDSEFLQQMRMAYHTFNFGVGEFGLVSVFVSYLVFEYQRAKYFHGSSQVLRLLEGAAAERLPALNDRVNDFLCEQKHGWDDHYIHLIRTLRKPFRHLHLMDSSLRRIVNLDFHNSLVRMDRLLNYIQDEDERKRFGLFLRRAVDVRLLRWLACFVMLGAAAEWLLILATHGWCRTALYFNIYPYLILGLGGVLLVQRCRPAHLFSAVIGTPRSPGMLLFLAVLGVALTHSVRPTHVANDFLFKRFMSSILFALPILPNVLLNAGYEFSFFLQYAPLTSIFTNASPEWAQELAREQNSRAFYFFNLRIVASHLLILLLRLISIRNVATPHQNDRLIKTNFLNRLRIRNETAVAREKMQMLMPAFVIDRISNFDIASSRGSRQKVSSRTTRARSRSSSATSATSTT